MTPSEIGGVVADWAAGKPSIRTIWLIGSRAKGTQRPDSDADLAIAVRMPSDYSEEFWTREDWQEELEIMLPYQVHILHLRRSREKVWRGAKEARFLLYCRSVARLDR